MKTDILKFKAVMLAIALSSGIPAAVHADGISPDEVAITTDADSEGAFIENIFVEIRDAVNGTVNLVESFIDKLNKESYSAFLIRCLKQLNYIEQTILPLLADEIAAAQLIDPNSDYCKVLEKTHKFVKTKAYSELLAFYTILDNHRKDTANAKNAMVLFGKLKPNLQKLVSVPTLDMLDQSLADIQQYLDITRYPAVAKEIDELKAMVKEIRVKSASMQSKIDLELLSIVSARLKKL